MKTFLKLLVATLLLSSPVFAELKGTPYLPEIDTRFDALEGNSSTTVSSLTAVRVARAIWNPSADSNQGSSTVNSGVHGLGVSLPAKAIIVRSYAEVVTAVTSTGNAQVKFDCEDSENIFHRLILDYNKPAGTIYNGRQYGNGTGVEGAASNMTDSIAAACEITATVSVGPVTAGKIIVFVDYVIGG